MTRFRALLLGLVALFAAFVAVEYFRPQPTNWTPTFINRDKIPYGTYALYDQLPALFPGQPISTVRLPIANQLLPGLGADVNTDTTAGSNLPALRPGRASYLFINDGFICSPLDRDALLRYVARGSHVLITGENISRLLLDSLHLELRPVLELDSLLLLRRMRLGGLPAGNGARARTTTLTLVNPPAGAAKSYPFPAAEVAYFFRATAGSRATVLAHDASRRPVLVRVPVGRGEILLSATPAAFSNLRLLQPATAGFAFAALSWLPANQPVFWDEYLKQGPLGEQSLLRVLGAHEALRWALWVGLAGMVLFALFEARRRQRIIPIIRPLPNTTLLFTSTVASLYRQGSNHALIAEKKIGLFQDFLRTRYHEPGLDLTDEPTRERLAQKAGVPRLELDELVRRMNRTLTARQVSDEELLALNQAISRFRERAA
ncbi:DUF4350 domain-containing protein [Hymenobacter lapidiphilus]|uniref:DUF4350 domain-containing protein n=1 Tax=Hymenobacter lapidiphilus TaxID=2608003 RepID=A0A7Y7U435_9BACT|nr:DUF4350 domain-containing protein [Hymenobacter lapidiphilus]NVO29847.1 DUF4350 domain-containing protein [Hymenobacter lapidiphilus]